MSKVIVERGKFTTDVNNQLSCKELAEKWGLTEREVRDIAKQLNLTIKKKREKRYSIIDETSSSPDLVPTQESN